MAKEYILTIHNELSKEYYEDLYKDLTEDQLKEFNIDLSKPKKNTIFRHILLKKSFMKLTVVDDGMMLGINCPGEINEFIQYNIVFGIQQGAITFDNLQYLSDFRINLGEYNLRVYLREHIVKNGKILNNWDEEYTKRNLAKESYIFEEE